MMREITCWPQSDMAAPPPRAIAKPVSDDQKNSVFLVFVFLVPLQLRKHVSSFDLLLPFFCIIIILKTCVCVLHKRGHVYQPNGVEATCWIFTARFPFVSFCFTSYFPLDCRARVLRHPAFPPSWFSRGLYSVKWGHKHMNSFASDWRNAEELIGHLPVSLPDLPVAFVLFVLLLSTANGQWWSSR